MFKRVAEDSETIFRFLHFSVEFIQHMWDCLLVASRQHQQPTEPTNMKIKPATKSAIAKYGIQTCIEAHEMHKDGNGANTVSHAFSILNGNTRSADAAINAGREIRYGLWKDNPHYRDVISFEKDEIEEILEIGC